MRLAVAGGEWGKMGACSSRLFVPRDPLTRVSLVLLAIALTTNPASAEKRITVAQLEKTIVADTAAKKKDAELVRQIGRVELSERITPAALARLQTLLKSGSGAMQALQL